MDRSRKKFILLSLSMLLVFLATTPYLHAQGTVRIDIPKQVKSNATRLVIKEKPKPKQEKIIKTNKGPGQKVKVVKVVEEVEVKEDTAYYANAGRKNSWIVGVGKELTKEEAMALPHYYRMTMKNSKGHWQHIEAMHENNLTWDSGSDLFYGCKIDFYSIYYFDEMAVCQWFCFSNIEEEELIEERSYDDEGNLIASGQFNKHPDGRIIISYNGSNGLPLVFDEDVNYTYGNVFAVTYDEEGRDGMIEYFDGAGYPKPSLLGYYQERMKYNDYGVVLERTFHDQIGNLMNNFAGVAMEKRIIGPDGSCLETKRYDKRHNLVTDRLLKE